MIRLNKTMKRFFACTLALAMLCVPALAEETSDMSALFSAARTLVFGTENVTMNASAHLSYDGTVFKNLTVQKLQAGADSRQHVVIQTPADGFHEPNGRSGSYTLWNSGSDVYWVMGEDPLYYQQSYNNTGTQTLLRRTRTRETLMDAAGAVVQTLSGHLQTEGSKAVFTMGQEDSSALLNAALTYVAAQYQQKAGYGGSGAAESFCSVVYEDWESCFRAWCEKNDMLNKQLIDAYMDGTATADQNAEFWSVGDVFYDAYYQEANDHGSGVLLVKRDATTEWFESENAYYTAKGLVSLTYVNYRTALLAYYNEQAGKSLDLDTFDEYLNTLPETASAALSKGMEDYWTEKVHAADPSAIAALVHEDGTLLTTSNLADMQNRQLSQYQVILSDLRELRLAGAEVTAERDDSGRLTSVSGTVTFTVVGQDGGEHELKVEGTMALSDYGTTIVEPFDPDSLLSYSDYWDYREQRSDN